MGLNGRIAFLYSNDKRLFTGSVKISKAYLCEIKQIDRLAPRMFISMLRLLGNCLGVAEFFSPIPKLMTQNQMTSLDCIDLKTLIHQIGDNLPRELE